jgi:cytochrome c6
VCRTAQFDYSLLCDSQHIVGLNISAIPGGKMLMTIIRKCRVGVIALLPLFLFAIPHSVAAQAGKADDGQKLYDQNCTSCHGPDGSGNTAIGKAVGAKDLRSAEAQKLTDAQIATQISQGKGNMPPFGGSLNKSNVNDLIAYVRDVGKKPAGAKKP